MFWGEQMDKNLIEKYKTQMMNTYRSAKGISANANGYEQGDLQGDYGELVVMVTTVNSLYPIENARVTIFEGDLKNRTIIDTDFTDESGRTKRFLLKTPQKSLSLKPDETQRVYALYSAEVKAEGYAEYLFLNIPVFSQTTSIQRANLLPNEILGEEKGPFVFNELQKYNL